MKLIILVLPIWAMAAEWPRPDFKSCTFYSKAEEVLNCSNHGSDYLTNYGLYYCGEFKKNRGQWSGAAQSWTDNVGQCLQEMIYDNRTKRISPCGQMEEFAFDVHPICYKQYGICNLSPSDIWGIFTTVRAVDLATRKSLSQMLNVTLTCISQLVSLEETGTFSRLVAISNDYSIEDRKMAATLLTGAPRKDSASRKLYFKRALRLLMSTPKKAAPMAAAEAYARGASPSASVGEADRAFFDCGHAVAVGSTSAACTKEMSADFRAIPKAQLKELSDVVPPQRMREIIDELQSNASAK